MAEEKETKMVEETITSEAGKPPVPPAKGS